TKREFERQVREITHPTRMPLRDALAIPDPTMALHSFVSNVSQTTQIGADLARDHSTMCVINSGGVSAVFLTESLYEKISDIRASLVSIGAHRTLAIVDEVYRRIRAAPGGADNPDVAILSDEFEAWDASLPPAGELADEVRDCLLRYVSEHIDEFEGA